MELTNNFLLPEPVCEAIRASIRPPRDGELHVTELVTPPQIVILRRRHWHELQADVSEFIWALFGTVAHRVLEGHASGEDSEHRLYISLENGWIITGQADLLSRDGVLTDYKFTKSAVLDFDKPEWLQQVNFYATMFRERGFRVESAQIIVFLRDWSPRGSSQPSAVHVIPVPLWPHEETLALMRELAEERIREIPRECTPEERWNKDDVWAVKKKKNKRAERLFKNREDALFYFENLVRSGKEAYEIEFRRGEDTRCGLYCPVEKFCEQKRRNLNV